MNVFNQFAIQQRKAGVVGQLQCFTTISLFVVSSCRSFIKIHTPSLCFELYSVRDSISASTRSILLKPTAGSLLGILNSLPHISSVKDYPLYFDSISLLLLLDSRRLYKMTKHSPFKLSSKSIKH